MTVDVVCALILNEGKILGTRRAEKSSRAGKWEFPGGKVKADEKPENAILRELEEELDISVPIIKRLPHIVYHYPETSIRLIPFICEWEGGEIMLKDHDQYAWIARDQLFEYDWSEADQNLIFLIQESTDFLHGPIV
jgi:8-oxo-dGTP diphosphatase